MGHPIGALPRTPFPASRDFPSRGNEKIGGTGYCVTYDTERKSRNADFISIAAERQSATLGAKGSVKPKNPWAEGPSILRTFSSEPYEPYEPYEPSRPQGVSKGVSNHFFVLLEQGYIIR